MQKLCVLRHKKVSEEVEMHLCCLNLNAYSSALIECFKHCPSALGRQRYHIVGREIAFPACELLGPRDR